jgi:HlyD family secretion protein
MLRQDMTVSVNIETGRRAQALAVPNDALLEARAGTATALLVRDGRLRRLPVKLGLRGLAFTEVTAGLAVGDTVLASAAAVKLADGTRLRAATQPLPSHGTDPSTRRESPVKFD